MRKVITFALILCVILCGCGQKAPKLGPADMLDSGTGVIYHLGDQKAVFDQAFGRGTTNDATGQVIYLSGSLVVNFDENDSAARIQADGSAARFSFFGFDFSKKLEDVEKRYEAHRSAGFDAYHAYYSKEGKSLEIHDAILLQDYTEHTLFVTTKDRPDTGLKAGDYMFYSIERRTGYPQP